MVYFMLSTLDLVCGKGKLFQSMISSLEGDSNNIMYELINGAFLVTHLKMLIGIVLPDD